MISMLSIRRCQLSYCATKETKPSCCNLVNILASSTENTFIIDVLDAKPKACWEGADQDVQIKEEGDPRGGLVLRHRRDDGDVDLGVAVEREGGGGETGL